MFKWANWGLRSLYSISLSIFHLSRLGKTRKVSLTYLTGPLDANEIPVPVLLNSLLHCLSAGYCLHTVTIFGGFVLQGAASDGLLCVCASGTVSVPQCCPPGTAAAVAVLIYSCCYLTMWLPLSLLQ